MVFSFCVPVITVNYEVTILRMWKTWLFGRYCSEDTSERDLSLTVKF